MSNTTTSWPVAARRAEDDPAAGRADATGIAASSPKATDARKAGIRTRRSGGAEWDMGEPPTRGMRPRAPGHPILTRALIFEKDLVQSWERGDDGWELSPGCPPRRCSDQRHRRRPHPPRTRARPEPGTVRGRPRRDGR